MWNAGAAWARAIIIVIPLVALVACGGEATVAPTPTPAAAVATLPPQSPTPSRLLEGEIQSGDTLAGVMMDAGVSGVQARGAVEAMRAAGLDLRLIQLGRAWRLELDADGGLRHFQYNHSKTERYHLDVSPSGAFLASKEDARVEMKPHGLKADISSNLSVAIHAAGEGNGLTQLLVDVFQWDINFYSDTRAGDTIEVYFTKEYVDGEPTGRYDQILAARYNGSFVGEREVFRFEDDYFDRKGRFARKNFLTAPLDVLRVTSRFGQRFHPVHKKWKAHTGVDYGAPRGTSVWAVADGTVSSVINSRTGYGKHVRVRHKGGYETLYGHLSRINVVQGQRVKQKMKVGEVGATGTATAPHLHFEVRVNGKRVNPAKQRMIPGRPIPKSKKAAYKEEMARLIDVMEQLTLLDDEPIPLPPPPLHWTVPVGDGLL